MKYLINRIIDKSNISVKASMIFFVCLSIVYIKSAQADFIVRDGFTPLGRDSINIQTESKATSLRYSAGVPSYFGIYLGPSISVNLTCSQNGVQSLTSIGGYSGIEIAPNVLLVIYNSTLTSTAQISQSPMGTQKATFDAKGNLSVNTGTQMSGKICYEIRYDPIMQDLSLHSTRSTIGDLQWGIYVQPGTQSSELKVPNILIGKYSIGSNWATQALAISGQTLKINPAVRCVINPPPAINFGTVNLWHFAGNTAGSPGGNRKDILASVDGNLFIECDYQGQTEQIISAKLSLRGQTQGFANDLQVTMDGTGSIAPATVRASMLNILAPCSSNVGAVYFSISKEGTGDFTNIEKLNQGTNTIPYRLSLCALPEINLNQFGSASAQATINLDWD